MTLKLEEKLVMDLAMIMASTKNSQIPEDKLAKLTAKYVQKNYSQLSKTVLKEFSIQVFLRYSEMLPEIVKIYKVVKK